MSLYLLAPSACPLPAIACPSSGHRLPLPAIACHHQSSSAIICYQLLSTAIIRTTDHQLYCCACCSIYLKLWTTILDTNYAAGFMCPVCRYLPHDKMIINMDGIVLGFQRSMRLQQEQLPTEGLVAAT